MGLRYYKRTKKSGGAWVNTSVSRRGVNASVSMQSSDKRITVNIGKNGRRRMTINFGNGVRYVKQHTPKKGKGFFSWLFSKKKTSSAKKPIKKDVSPSWIDNSMRAIEQAERITAKPIEEKKTLSFEEKAKAIAEKQAARAREMRNARENKIKIADDGNFTPNQKRFMLILLFVVIFVIQKCSG